MRTLKDARKEKRFNQEMLAALCRVPQENISTIERGLCHPNQATKARIEAVLGKIDWIETKQAITIRDPSYGEAEKLVQKLVEVCAAMARKDKQSIKKLVIKYLK